MIVHTRFDVLIIGYMLIDFCSGERFAYDHFFPLSSDQGQKGYVVGNFPSNPEEFFDLGSTRLIDLDNLESDDLPYYNNNGNEKQEPLDIDWIRYGDHNCYELRRKWNIEGDPIYFRAKFQGPAKTTDKIIVHLFQNFDHPSRAYYDPINPRNSFRFDYQKWLAEIDIRTAYYRNRLYRDLYERYGQLKTFSDRGYALFNCHIARRNILKDLPEQCDKEKRDMAGESQCDIGFQTPLCCYGHYQDAAYGWKGKIPQECQDSIEIDDLKGFETGDNCTDVLSQLRNSSTCNVLSKKSCNPQYDRKCWSHLACQATCLTRMVLQVEFHRSGETTISAFTERWHLFQSPTMYEMEEAAKGDIRPLGIPKAALPFSFGYAYPGSRKDSIYQKHAIGFWKYSSFRAMHVEVKNSYDKNAFHPFTDDEMHGVWIRWIPRNNSRGPTVQVGRETSLEPFVLHDVVKDELLVDEDKVGYNHGWSAHEKPEILLPSQIGTQVFTPTAWSLNAGEGTNIEYQLPGEAITTSKPCERESVFDITQSINVPIKDEEKKKESEQPVLDVSSFLDAYNKGDFGIKIYLGIGISCVVAALLIMVWLCWCYFASSAMKKRREKDKIIARQMAM